MAKRLVRLKSTAKRQKMKELNLQMLGGGLMAKDLTNERIDAILEDYIYGGSLAVACNAHGSSTSGLTHRASKDPIVKAAIEEAKLIKVGLIEEVVHDAAVNGLNKQMLNKQGEAVDTLQQDAKLMTALLGAENPEKWREKHEAGGNATVVIEAADWIKEIKPKEIAKEEIIDAEVVDNSDFLKELDGEE